jgi:hypothetical protein
VFVLCATARKNSNRTGISATTQHPKQLIHYPYAANGPGQTLS